MSRHEDIERIEKIMDEITALTREFCEIAKPYKDSSYAVDVVRTNIFSMLGVEGYSNFMGDMASVIESIETHEDDIDCEDVDDLSFGLEQDKNVSNDETKRVFQSDEPVFLSPEGIDAINEAFNASEKDDPFRKIKAIKAYREETGVSLAYARRAVEQYIEDFLSDIDKQDEQDNREINSDCDNTSE